jgi:hypothetical protein
MSKERKVAEVGRHLSPRVQVDSDKLLTLGIRAAEMFGWALSVNMDDPDRPVISIKTPAGQTQFALPVKEVLSLCKVNKKEWRDYTPAQKQKLIEQYLKSL